MTNDTLPNGKSKHISQSSSPKKKVMNKKQKKRLAEAREKELEKEESESESELQSPTAIKTSLIKQMKRLEKATVTLNFNVIELLKKHVKKIKFFSNKIITDVDSDQSIYNITLINNIEKIYFTEKYYENAIFLKYNSLSPFVFNIKAKNDLHNLFCIFFKNKIYDQMCFYFCYGKYIYDIYQQKLNDSMKIYDSNFKYNNLKNKILVLEIEIKEISDELNTCPESNIKFLENQIQEKFSKWTKFQEDIKKYPDEYEKKNQVICTDLIAWYEIYLEWIKIVQFFITNYFEQLILIITDFLNKNNKLEKIFNIINTNELFDLIVSLESIDKTYFDKYSKFLKNFIFGFLIFKNNINSFLLLFKDSILNLFTESEIVSKLTDADKLIIEFCNLNNDIFQLLFLYLRKKISGNFSINEIEEIKEILKIIFTSTIKEFIKPIELYIKDLNTWNKAQSKKDYFPSLTPEFKDSFVLFQKFADTIINTIDTNQIIIFILANLEFINNDIKYETLPDYNVCENIFNCLDSDKDKIINILNDKKNISLLNFVKMDGIVISIAYSFYTSIFLSLIYEFKITDYFDTQFILKYGSNFILVSYAVCCFNSIEESINEGFIILNDKSILLSFTDNQKNLLKFYLHNTNNIIYQLLLNIYNEMLKEFLKKNQSQLSTSSDSSVAKNKYLKYKSKYLLLKQKKYYYK